jgi:hypothetical protein
MGVGRARARVVRLDLIVPVPTPYAEGQGYADGSPRHRPPFFSFSIYFLFKFS